MIRKFLWFQFFVILFVSIAGCGGRNTDPVQVTSSEMLTYPDENVIVVEGEIMNVSEQEWLVYLFISLYGDFGMVKDNMKKLLNRGRALGPGESIDFSFEFPYDPEIKKHKARVEAKPPI